MFEIFMLTTLLGIGLSQLIPEPKNDPGNKRSYKKGERSRSDSGKKLRRVHTADRIQRRIQAHSTITFLNSTGGTGRLKKKPCIW